MHDRLRHLGGLLVSVGSLLVWQCSKGCGRPREQARLHPKAEVLQSPERSDWKLPDAPQAIAAARRFVGLNTDVSASAELVTVENDARLSWRRNSMGGNYGL